MPMSDSLTIAENERRFVAQELHDHVIQTILQINMQVSICKRYLELGNIEETTGELNNLEAQITTVSQQLRDLIADLRPPLSDEGTFRSILQKQIDIHHRRGGPPVRLIQADSTLIEPPGPKKLALARIIQEGLLNIRKHAQATQVTISLEQKDSQLELTIADDGIGFDDALIPNPFAEKGGAGMVNMYIRASAIGAKLDIESQPDQGTTLKIIVPL